MNYWNSMSGFLSTNLKKAAVMYLDTYFPLSAEMYSSQEIVLGEGGVKDCLLAG